MTAAWGKQYLINIINFLAWTINLGQRECVCIFRWYATEKFVWSTTLHPPRSLGLTPHSPKLLIAPSTLLLRDRLNFKAARTQLNFKWTQSAEEPIKSWFYRLFQGGSRCGIFLAISNFFVSENSVLRKCWNVIFIGTDHSSLLLVCIQCVTIKGWHCKLFCKQ